MSEELEDSHRLTQLEDAVFEFKDAIVEFRHVIKYVISGHAEDIKSLQVDVSNLKSNIYDSCDVKTKEIDNKVKDSKTSILKIIGYACALGLGAVLYFNTHVSGVEANMASIQTSQHILEKSQEHNTDQVDTIMDKIDAITILVQAKESE